MWLYSKKVFCILCGCTGRSFFFIVLYVVVQEEGFLYFMWLYRKKFLFYRILCGCAGRRFFFIVLYVVVQEEGSFLSYCMWLYRKKVFCILCGCTGRSFFFYRILCGCTGRRFFFVVFYVVVQEEGRTSCGYFLMENI
jgi:hypothetical protein